MRKYSAFAPHLHAKPSGHNGWPEQWTSPEPRADYDVIIVGGGGHGLATAYYLAKEHGITNVAVLEKGWLGGGNTGRNTTIIRSNYLYDESAAIYDHAVKLWDGLSQELNYNVMYSPRGVMMLAHNVHDVQVFKRHIHSNRLNGIDNEWLTPEEAKAFCPPLNISQSARYPVMGAALQRRGGTARHDAVAWGYARAAFGPLGVPPSSKIAEVHPAIPARSANGHVTASDITMGSDSLRSKVGSSCAWHSSVADLAYGRLECGIALRIHLVQVALVSEPVKGPVSSLRCHGRNTLRC